MPPNLIKAFPFIAWIVAVASGAGFALSSQRSAEAQITALSREVYTLRDATIQNSEHLKELDKQRAEDLKSIKEALSKLDRVGDNVVALCQVTRGAQCVR